MEFYQYMMSHSILDLLDIENTEKKLKGFTTQSGTLFL